MFPTRLQAAARNINRRELLLGIRRDQQRLGQVLIEISLVIIAMHDHRILGRGRPVQAKSAFAGAPVIISVTPIRGDQTIALGKLSVNPILGAITQRTAIANSGNRPFFIADCQRYQPTLSILALFSDDVDDAINRVGSPQAAAGTANDLDPFDVGQEQILNFPIHAGKLRVIDRSAINQHQQFIGEAAVETANGDGPAAGIDPRYFHAGREPQRLHDVGDSRPAHIIGADHKNRRRRVLQGLFDFCRRHHFDLHQVFDAELG